MAVTTVMDWATMEVTEVTMAMLVFPTMPMLVFPTATDGLMVPTTDLDPIFLENVRLKPNPRLRLTQLFCMEVTEVTMAMLVSPTMPMLVFPTATDGLMVPTTDSDPIFWENVRLKLNLRLRLTQLFCMVVTTVMAWATEVTMVMVSPIMPMLVFPTAMDGLMDLTTDLDLTMENRYFS